MTLRMVAGLWFAVLLPGWCAAQPAAVILVRHAERDGANDALTPAGHARAKALARLFKDAKVEVIVHSTTARTKDTAAPLAAQSGITPLAVSNEKLNQHVRDVTAAILAAANKDKVVLYVGHSDTVGLVMNKLGCAGDLAIPLDEFDNLFLVVPKAPTPVVVRLRYPKE